MKLQERKDNFIIKSNNKHLNKYDYSKVDYKNSLIKVCIICPLHGDFFQTPQCHARGKGCPKCAIEDKKLYTQEEFINLCNEIHNNKYEYVNIEYVDTKHKINILCKDHGFFLQRAGAHLVGEGCPKCCCYISKKEELWLSSLNIENLLKHHTIYLSNNKWIKVDGFDEQNNVIYEFYGDYWHGNPLLYDENLINNSTGKTFGQIYLQTIERENKLKALGYNVISMWESDFNYKKSDII